MRLPSGRGYQHHSLSEGHRTGRRGHSGLRDPHTQVYSTEIYLLTTGAQEDHTVWSQRYRQILPSTGTLGYTLKYKHYYLPRKNISSYLEINISTNLEINKPLVDQF